MSLNELNAFYQETLLLLDKNEDIPTTITEGQVVNGDLTPFRHRMEAVNTGNQLQNNGVLTLRVPPDGTFVRKEPILVDESAKDDYIIEFQMKQDRDNDGVFEEEGKLFRFFIGQPTIQDDEHGGETLKITLIPVEYRAREVLNAERLTFFTSRKAFENRILAYNEIKGAENTNLLFIPPADPDEEIPTGSIKLPNKSKIDFRPLAPTTTHDLFREIIDLQAEPGVAGGVFEDFFFDYDAFSGSTRTVLVKAEAEGTIDRGVVLDPLVFETSDTQKDNLINVDLIKFKNNVIMEGNPTGGTLPMDHARYSSAWEHGKQRRVWDPTVQYFDGATTPNTDQSSVRITDDTTKTIRFFVANSDNLNVNPLTTGQGVWDEDFSTIPRWDFEAEYNLDEIVTRNVTVGPTLFYRFFKARPLLPAEIIPKNGLPPEINPDWLNLGIDFPLTRRARFFSYTPWTSEFDAMKTSSLMGIQDDAQRNEFESAGFEGVVPDWNYVRAGFDREEADNRFELVSGKDVIDTLDDEPDVDGRYIGARYLVSQSPLGTGKFAGHADQIAEWNGDNDFTSPTTVSSPPKNTDDWRFSRDPTGTPRVKDIFGVFVSGGGDTIIHQARGVILEWDINTNQWTDIWNIMRLKNKTLNPVTQALMSTIKSGSISPVLTSLFGQVVSLLLDPNEFGDATRHSPLHICKEIKLVTGASGIPGQAFEMRYNWNVREFKIIFGLVFGIVDLTAKRIHFNSLGAWWWMQFPYPKHDSKFIDQGGLYKNPIIDGNNLDRNHLGIRGWNEGIDSEDLGRLQIAHFKVKLSLFGSFKDGLVIGYTDLPMVYWAVDVFDRIWFAEFKIRRNGEYNLQRISFGENSAQQLHYGRYDELQRLFGIVLDFDWLLREKEFTGIEFDWRFVKSTGMFYKYGYNSEGMYVANQFPDYVKNIAEQTAGKVFPFVASTAIPGQSYNANDLLIDHANIAVDEFHFEKQLFTNSDDEKIIDGRTILDHDSGEVDYDNLKAKAVASRERKKFVEQAWFMQAHGDVRIRFGEKFTARGPRVPNPLGEQDLICNEVKHIIDSDGYMVQLTGKRKFILTS